MFLFASIVRRVLPKQERLLLSLFSAHAIDFLVAALSDSAHLKPIHHAQALDALDAVLADRHGRANQFASAIWSGSVYQCMARLAAEPVWTSDPDQTHFACTRRYWALHCIYVCQNIMANYDLPLAVADQPDLLRHAVRLGLTDAKFEAQSCAAAVMAASTLLTWRYEVLHDRAACDQWVNGLYVDAIGVMVSNALASVEDVGSLVPNMLYFESTAIVFACNAVNVCCCQLPPKIADKHLLDIFQVRTPSGKSFMTYLLSSSSLQNPTILPAATRMASQLKAVLSRLDGTCSLAAEIRNFLGDVRWRRTVCGNPACATSLAAMKKCSRCETASYCSKECQAADWPRHKLACKKS
eukprot:TRINITY_DN3045_c0_g1_i1.p1 TRINITY_DN3045_c0_g1~~TRINITY_DN3045_c0_g1_i1.p1  ORF type:complete len:354 (+),score=20.36 TRINITY_DN3045_c0_g1_i1:644-1705(+)